MKRTFYIGLFLLFSTIVMIWIGILRGYIGIDFYIFPIIYGSGLYITFAVIALFLSMLIIFLSMFEMENAKKVNIGGVVLIGPIPIVFGNSKILIILSIIVLVFILLLLLL